SIEEEASVEIPADIKEHLGKEIKLNKKDFEKLVKNKREKYIEQIKETFKEPEAVFIDENDDLIFAKSFNDKLFFVNVNRDYGEAFKALSLAPKKNNNLLNKLDKAREILKLDSKLRDYTAQQAFTGVLSASNKSSGEIIPQEIEQAEIKKLLEEYGEQISSNYPQETARLILEQNKNDGIVLSGFKIKGKSYDPEIEAMQFKTKKAKREFESLMESYDIKGDFLNFKEAYSFKPNDEAFLQYLAKYEGDENAKLALAYNLAKQLVMRRGGGRAEVYTTDFLRQMHILENQNSTT
ncbi:hypothetical protein I0O17_001736, partial [Campylobacter upsaliensis]|nr:hypothetical protein [Campylobacter upsaliensis]